MITIIKRDGKEVPFDKSKIIEAIKAAASAAEQEVSQKFCLSVAEEILKKQKTDKMSVDQIQDFVENALMDSHKEVARKYIIYRQQRDLKRKQGSKMIKTFNEIIDVIDSDIKNENANINGNTPAGQMMKFGSESSKDYALNYLLNPKYAEAYKSGRIHIHDLDYYPTRTFTCVQMDLDKIFKDGFSTSDGGIREPKTIRAYSSLAAIALQCNQNEQHGGQGIPAFDFFMAKGVKLSFEKTFYKYVKLFADNFNGTKETLASILGPLEMGNEVLKSAYPKAYDAALTDVEEDTLQAMEAFIHNMCSMHSRGGGQVVFSSINYGTDTSPEGRLVMHKLLDATEKGLGNGETPIFPIQIFKVKEGVNFSERDYSLALSEDGIENVIEGNLDFENPNFDLFLKACKVSAKRLFPNFLYLDAPFNKHDKWNSEDPERWRHEMASMGCRTRVFDDINGERTAIGRGNLSFSTANLVRPAIEAVNEAINEARGGFKENIQEEAIKIYMNKVSETIDLIAEQLYDRYLFQKKAKAKQFPFLLGQGVWKTGQELGPDDSVGSAADTGTLSIGFIGLAEALKMLTGKHHGECEKSQELGISIVSMIREICDKHRDEKMLNYSCIATPAEGLAGRFTLIDREEFGEIAGVTDKEYYTNSSHVPVYFPITAHEKIKIEAPYHKLTNAGHILYVEIDGSARKNLRAYIKIVREMFMNEVGYGAINHPVDRCLRCGHESEIDDSCPKCGESNLIDRIRRITGYLVGGLDRWNSFKKAEERDRVKHS